MKAEEPLLRMCELVKHFPVGRARAVHAVDGVTLDIARGETLGLVGESGCGKTTLGRLVCRLEDPTRGELQFDGIDILGLLPRQLRQFRRRMQMIFQDPFSSLNPHRTIAQTLALPLLIRGLRSKADLHDRVSQLLQLVGLDQSFAHRFPHQLSGGQRQRVGIARAIACEPELIVADEPVASLDVSIQAQILEILGRLQQRLRATTLFISHDVSVVSYVSQRIAVMYLGRIVEVGSAEQVIQRPLHPYARALLAAVPRIDRDTKRPPISLSGDPPSPMEVPAGCRFHTRCYLDLVPECFSVDPPLRQVRPSHLAACHLAGDSS